MREDARGKGDSLLSIVCNFIAFLLSETGQEELAVLQYDYFRAYLQFFDPAGKQEEALRETSNSVLPQSEKRRFLSEIAKKYKNYPVVKKRKLFEDIELQILESMSNVKGELKIGDFVARLLDFLLSCAAIVQETRRIRANARCRILARRFHSPQRINN